MASIETVRVTTDNGTVFVTSTVADGAEVAEGPIHLQLAHHDEVEVAWWASFACTPSGAVWQGQVALELAPFQRIYQLTRAQDNAEASLELSRSCFLNRQPTETGSPVRQPRWSGYVLNKRALHASTWSLLIPPRRPQIPRLRWSCSRTACCLRRISGSPASE